MVLWMLLLMGISIMMGLGFVISVVAGLAEENLKTFGFGLLLSSIISVVWILLTTMMWFITKGALL